MGVSQREERLAATVRAWQGKRILVLGDVVADELVVGVPQEIAREAPVLVLRHAESSILPGGATNVAANAAALGAQVEVCGVVGDDQTGRQLIQALQESRAGLRRGDGRPLPPDDHQDPHLRRGRPAAGAAAPAAPRPGRPPAGGRGGHGRDGGLPGPHPARDRRPDDLGLRERGDPPRTDRRLAAAGGRPGPAGGGGLPRRPAALPRGAPLHPQPAGGGGHPGSPADGPRGSGERRPAPAHRAVRAGRPDHPRAGGDDPGGQGDRGDPPPGHAGRDRGRPHRGGGHGGRDVHPGRRRGGHAAGGGRAGQPGSRRWSWPAWGRPPPPRTTSWRPSAPAPR